MAHATGVSGDGKAPVLCATLGAVHCTMGPRSAHGCVQGIARTMVVPQFIRLDFSGKRVTTTRESGVEKMSEIGGVSRGNGHIVVQGVDDGHGWSLVLEEKTGHMTASAVGDEEGMMIFGSCTQL